LEKQGYIDATKAMDMFDSGVQKLQDSGSERHDYMLYEGYTVLKIEMALRSAGLIFRGK
jgi:hypothetical protein